MDSSGFERDLVSLHFDFEALLFFFIHRFTAFGYIDELYHYTSVATLDSIVKNRCIWLFDVSGMNDATESLLARRQLAHHFRNGIGCGSHRAAKILRRAASIVESSRYNIYLFCMAGGRGDNRFDSEESLGMWRAYGDNGRGVAAIVDADYLRKRFLTFIKADCLVSPKEFHSKAGRLDRDVIYEYVVDFIDHFEKQDDWSPADRKRVSLDALNLDRTQSFSRNKPILAPCVYENPSKDSHLCWQFYLYVVDILTKYTHLGDDAVITELIAEYAVKVCALLKHHGFREEKEWRLVLVRDSREDDAATLTRANIQRRYHPVPLPLRALRRVLGGPISDPSRIREVTGKRRKLPVSLSTIPYRPSGE